MASEILQRPEMNRILPSNLKAVAEGVANAASVQGKESLEVAIRSFQFIQQKQDSADQLFALLSEATVPEPGFTEHPSKYFSHLLQSKTSSAGTEIVSSDQVYAAIRNPNFNYKHGLNSFLKSGIQEALASLKISVPSNVSAAASEPLNDLLSPQSLSKPDRNKLLSSLHVMNTMFSTLKNLQGDVSDLQKNLFRSIRV
jgi:hypothetical protein